MVLAPSQVSGVSAEVPAPSVETYVLHSSLSGLVENVVRPEGMLAKAAEASSLAATVTSYRRTFGSFEAAWYFILSIATGTRGISTLGDALSGYVSSRVCLLRLAHLVADSA